MITESGIANAGSAYYDPEKNATGDHYCFTETTPTHIRHDFVKKVFGIVGLQLLATFGFLGLAYNVKPLRLFLMVHYYLGLVCGIIFMALLLAVACKPALTRSNKSGIPIVSALTICLAVETATIAVFYAPFEITIAAGITTALVLGISAFAFQTKYDFTGWIMYMFVISLGLMLASILLFIFPTKIGNILYATAGALLVSVYLIIDIQLVVGGKKREWTIDDYLLASVFIYSDIISLFLYILRLVGLFNDT